MSADSMEILTGAGGLAIGAAALKLAQMWLEKRASQPSKAADAADLVTAAAAFQAALNTAAAGQIAALAANQLKLHEEIETLKIENSTCRLEGEQLRQQARGLEQRLDSLMRQLRDPAATSAGGSLSDAVIEMADGNVIVTRPARQRRTK